MAERPTRLVFLTLVAAAGALIPLALYHSSEPLGIVLTWAALLAVGEHIRVPATGRRVLYIGVGVAAAVPLLLRDPAAVAAVYGIGLLVALAARLAGRTPHASRFFLSEAASIAAYAAMFFGVLAVDTSAVFDSQTAELVAVVAGGLAWFVTGSFVHAVVGHGERRQALRYLWLEGIADWPVALSLFASGSLFAFAYPVIGSWAVPTALIPYAFSHVAFVRYADTEATYRQTIRALSRIPEVAGLAEEGHSTRTADLAVAIGKDIGLRPDLVTELEYGALMHDIGRITLNEPAILKAGYTDQDIARWGSQIIAEAPYLANVADYVLQQHAPYRRPGEQWDESLPLPSKIIKVASAYDQAVTETGLPPIEAVEVLHRGAAYDFDPRVVRSLRRVIAAKGSIAY